MSSKRYFSPKFFVALFGIIVSFPQPVPVQCFKQELWLYLRGGNYVYIEKNIPDLAAFRTLLPMVERGCTRGYWRFYTDVNYKGSSLHLGYFDSASLHCVNVHATSWSSLHHWAAGNTSTDALSLYSDTYQGGEEIYVSGKAYAGILTTVKSFAATGTSNWTLYEGKHLDGKSICLAVPGKHGHYFSFVDDIKSELNLTKIGSVYKGCDSPN